MIKKLSLNLTITYTLIFIIAIASIDILVILSYTRSQLSRTESVYMEVARFLSSLSQRNIKITNLINTGSPNSKNINGRVIYLDNQGRVLADSLNQFEGKKITNKEIRKTLSTKQTSVGYYTFNNRNMAMFLYPVVSEDDVYGIIMISAYLDEVYNEISSFTYKVIAISTVVMLIVILMSVLMGKKITKPIKTLTSASKEILNGKIGTIVTIKRKDEIGVLADTFNLMSQELHKVDIGRKRFVSDISHELKTPLASMKVLIESLIDSDYDKETSNEYLGDINSEIDRLSSLVKSLITATRLEEVKLKLVSSDIYSEIQSVVKIFEPIALLNGIELINNCSKTLYIELDREMFKEVIINLIDNGIKYGVPNGFLKLETRISEDKIELHIKDNGLGINQSELPFIFENFYRVDESRTRDKGGNGIGLFIVKRICDLHKWKISVSSEPNKGTEFTIIF